MGIKCTHTYTCKQAHKPTETNTYYIFRYETMAMGQKPFVVET